MSFLLHQEREKGIHELTLNRPEKRNALNQELLENLLGRLEELSADQDCRSVILRANGPAFCAGMDLVEAADESQGEITARLVGKVLLALVRLPSVSIAAVQGPALAGGAGIACACDFVIASENAQFGFPEVQRGLVAAMVMTILRRQLPERFIRELVLLGDPVNANRALEMSLINQIAKSGEMEGIVWNYLSRVKKCGPSAVRESKKLLLNLWPAPLDAQVQMALECLLETRQSEEFLEGSRSFRDRQIPKWQQTS